MFNEEKIFELYKRYNVRASKRFGQNFLKDESIINLIVEKANVENKDVIEIGPGLGALTMPLLDIVKSLNSYEIDEDMKRVLEGEINNDKFTLIFKDFLDEELNWEGKKDVVANIPYNITSPILFKLFKNIDKINTATLMVQKEVGERILANPSNKNYGKLSVTSQFLSDIVKIIDVPANSFVPAPKVDSIVIKFNFKKESYDKEFIEFIKNSFNQQRKTLINNLKNYYSKELIEKTLLNNKLPINVRPQQLTVGNFIKIYNEL